MMKELFMQYETLKQKHAGVLILFRKGDYYVSIDNDAQNVASVMLERLMYMFTMESVDGIMTTRFKFTKLDAVLPALIRAGHRIAIADAIDNNRR